MVRILKYPVPVGSRFTLDLPMSASVLAVQQQRADVQLWALIDTNHVSVQRSFIVFPTGAAIGSGLVAFEGRHRYIGTFQTDGGDFVGHLFEEI